nr:hypothetical protein [Tanacetum cinerariifolium]
MTKKHGCLVGCMVDNLGKEDDDDKRGLRVFEFFNCGYTYDYDLYSLFFKTATVKKKVEVGSVVRAEVGTLVQAEEATLVQAEEATLAQIEVDLMVQVVED